MEYGGGSFRYIWHIHTIYFFPKGFGYKSRDKVGIILNNK